MSQNTASLVDRLLAAMTLEDKIAQLNMPLPDMIPGAAAGQDALDADNPIRRFIEGRLTPALGAGGGVFHTLPFAGVTPAEQAEFHNALQALTAQTRHGIPLLIVAEGTHGVVFPGATIFPEGPGLGSMWNLDRVAEVYGAVAAEARALGVHFICTVVIEPTRDPRLGRSVEAYTEDVLYTAWIAKTILDAAQGESLNSPDTVGVVFCHFPGQSEPQAGLERGAMHISERKLRSVFLPPWESVTGPGAAASVMATYAAIDGKPTHGSAALLTGLLRDELGFDGIVLSEGNGLRTLEYEGTATGQQDAGRQAIHAGVDVSITWEDAYLHPLRDLVLRGVVPEAEIDRAVRRVLAMKDRLGLFDSVQVDPARAARVVGGDHHRRLALEAARESIVLLKNDGPTLPLSEGGTVAVLGPNAADWRAMAGDYSPSWLGQDGGESYESVREALTRLSGSRHEIVGARGCGVLDGTDDEMDDAVALARRADVAVIVVGDRLPYGDHAGVNGVPGTVGEGLDAASLDLPGRQEELIRRVHATGTPVVVVLINGRPMSIAWTAQHVPAIVEAWLPGHHGGQAIAEVLLGDTEPSGRLPITVPRHVGQLPVFYNHETAKDFRSEIAHRYADMPWTPLWWFGHGLAYTTFTHAPAVVEAGERVRVTVTVTNTGHRRGAEVVQVYVRDLIASSAPLSRQLAGFRKVWLEPHESRAVSVDLDMRAFRTLQDDLTWQIEDGSFHILVGASSDAITSSVHVVATTDGDVVSFATAPGDGETRANVADSWPYPGP